MEGYNHEKKWRQTGGVGAFPKKNFGSRAPECQKMSFCKLG